MKEEYINLRINKKRQKIINKDLKELIKEVTKIRGELGDNPEITNIEYSIVKKDDEIVLSIIKRILKYSIASEYIFATAFDEMVDIFEINDDTSKILVLMAMMLCLFMISDVLKGDKKQLEDFKENIMNKLQILRLTEANKKEKHQKHCEEIINNYMDNNDGEKIYVKKR